MLLIKKKSRTVSLSLLLPPESRFRNSRWKRASYFHMTVYVSTVNTCFSRLLFIKNPVVQRWDQVNKTNELFSQKISLFAPHKLSWARRITFDMNYEINRFYICQSVTEIKMENFDTVNVSCLNVISLYFSLFYFFVKSLFLCFFLSFY